MNAALLCPGPSLAAIVQSDVDGYSVRVGVNRAAVLLDCHLWAALDYPVLRDWHNAVIGTPQVLTRRQTWTDFGRTCRLRDVVLVEELPAPPVKQWDLKTATCALALLATMPVTSIDVFGADWSDAPDFDGHATAGQDRSAARWAQERATWDALVEWLDGRGVSVCRRNTAASTASRP